jgi:hypothetical protein
VKKMSSTIASLFDQYYREKAFPAKRQAAIRENDTGDVEAADPSGENIRMGENR